MTSCLLPALLTLKAPAALLQEDQVQLQAVWLVLMTVRLATVTAIALLQPIKEQALVLAA